MTSIIESLEPLHFKMFDTKEEKESCLDFIMKLYEHIPYENLELSSDRLPKVLLRDYLKMYIDQNIAYGFYLKDGDEEMTLVAVDVLYIRDVLDEFPDLNKYETKIYNTLDVFTSPAYRHIGLEMRKIRNLFAPAFTESLKREMQIKNTLNRLPLLEYKVLFTNIRGLRANLLAVHHHLETEKPGLLFLSETIIENPSDVSLSKFQYPGFTLVHNFQSRAGVCVYVRDDLCYRRLQNLDHPDFSVLWILVETEIDKVIYGFVYRPQREDQVTDRYMQYLSEKATKAQQCYPSAQLVLLGDFNAHHKEWLYPYLTTDYAGIQLYKLAQELNLIQKVQGPTRRPDKPGYKTNCLDLLLTTDSDRCSVPIVISPLGNSDHCLVKCVYYLTDPSPEGSRRYDRSETADCSVPMHAETDVSGQAMEINTDNSTSEVTTSGGTEPMFNAECNRALALQRAAYRELMEANSKSQRKLLNYKKANKLYFKTLRHSKAKLRRKPQKENIKPRGTSFE